LVPRGAGCEWHRSTKYRLFSLPQWERREGRAAWHVLVAVNNSFRIYKSMYESHITTNFAPQGNTPSPQHHPVFRLLVGQEHPIVSGDTQEYHAAYRQYEGMAYVDCIECRKYTNARGGLLIYIEWANSEWHSSRLRNLGFRKRFTLGKCESARRVPFYVAPPVSPPPGLRPFARTPVAVQSKSYSINASFTICGPCVITQSLVAPVALLRICALRRSNLAALVRSLSVSPMQISSGGW
jgi:hypothetical protein